MTSYARASATWLLPYILATTVSSRARVVAAVAAVAAVQEEECRVGVYM